MNENPNYLAIVFYLVIGLAFAAAICNGKIKEGKHPEMVCGVDVFFDCIFLAFRVSFPTRVRFIFGNFQP